MAEKPEGDRIIDLSKDKEVEDSYLNPYSKKVEDFRISFSLSANKPPFESESNISEWSRVAVNFFNHEEIKTDSKSNPKLLTLKFKDSVGLTKFLSGIKKSVEKSGLQHSETKEMHLINSSGGKNVLYYKKKSDEIHIPLAIHSWPDLLTYLTVFFKNLG